MMDRATFRELADRDDPAVVRVAADLATDADPLAAFAALADGPYGFLLESAEKTDGSDPDGAFSPGSGSADRHARYSFVGYDPDAVVSLGPAGREVARLHETPAARRVAPGADGDVLDGLRDALPDVERVGFPDADRQALDGGLVGFLAYDAVYDLFLDEVGVERPDSRLPDAEFALTTRTLAFDHEAGDVSLVFTPVVEAETDVDALYDDLRAEADRVERALAGAEVPASRGFERGRETTDHDRDAYEDAVRRAKEYVRDGDVYQAVVSRERTVAGDVEPRDLYAALRDVNPSPYMYLLAGPERTVVGASPETLASVHDDRVLANPIAGTCPRGGGPVEDRALAGEMLADAKERAEHTMLVDLARNDVRRVSEPGSVEVPEFMRVLKYSHVQHIESTVTGRLATGKDADDGSAAGESASYDAFDAVRACFPAGTLAGAPKVRAMERVHELEASPRGIYGGGVGYVSWTGDADMAIAIRTATVERGDPDRVRVRAGAGVVADSDPAAEFEETEKKMGGVLAALRRVECAAPPEVPR